MGIARLPDFSEAANAKQFEQFKVADAISGGKARGPGRQQRHQIVYARQNQIFGNRAPGGIGGSAQSTPNLGRYGKQIAFQMKLFGLRSITC